jgi:transcriptional regulator with XRE-family HTH domain
MDNLQNMLFQQIRQQCKDQPEMVERTADLLGISKDSVYRRVRGETQLLFDDIVTLAKGFSVSLDDLFFKDQKSILFKGQYLLEDEFGLKEMLAEMQTQLLQVSQIEDVNIIYVSKDIPVFYYLMFPPVAAFKIFVWVKSQFQFDTWKNQSFTFSILTPELRNMATAVAKTYSSIPSVEILNADNILNDLRQLEYYWETKVIVNPEDLVLIYASLHSMVSHMKAQASAGKKYLVDSELPGAELKLFVNDFFVGDNTLLIGNQVIKMIFLNHSAINFMSTQNRYFVEYNEAFIRNLVRKSTLISEVGERTRDRFFHLIKERIRQSEQKTLGRSI